MVPALLDVVPLWLLVSFAVNVFFGVWLPLSASHKTYTFAPKVLKALLVLLAASFPPADAHLGVRTPIAWPADKSVDDALSAAYNTPAPDAQEVLKTVRALRRLPTPLYLAEATKSAESIDSTLKTVNTPPLSPPSTPTDIGRLSATKSAPSTKVGPALPRVFASAPNPYAGLPMMELLAQIPGAPDAPLSPFKRYAPQEFRLSRSLPDVLGILVNERARRLEPPAPFTPRRQGASIEELLGGLSDAPTTKHESEPTQSAPTSRLPNMPPQGAVRNGRDDEKIDEAAQELDALFDAAEKVEKAHNEQRPASPAAGPSTRRPTVARVNAPMGKKPDRRRLSMFKLEILSSDERPPSNLPPHDNTATTSKPD